MDHSAPAKAPDSADYVYGEVPVEAQIHSAQRASPDEIVRIGQKIWAAVTASGVAPDDDAGNDALLGRLQGEYQDFATSFPLVLRWMVQMRKFHAAALRKYLLRHACAKLTTREGFLELQAEYLVYLYRETTRRPDEGFVRRYHAAIVQQLLDEDKAFLKLQKEAAAEEERVRLEIDADRRQRLYEYLLAQKVAREQTAAASAPQAGSPAASRAGEPAASRAGSGRS